MKVLRTEYSVENPGRGTGTKLLEWGVSVKLDFKPIENPLKTKKLEQFMGNQSPESTWGSVFCPENLVSMFFVPSCNWVGVNLSRSGQMVKYPTPAQV